MSGGWVSVVRGARVIASYTLLGVSRHLNHDSRPTALISADASHGRESPQHLAATLGLGCRNWRSCLLLTEIPQVPSPCLKQSWTAPLVGGLFEAIEPINLAVTHKAKPIGMH
jgi:hypothetical protein